MVCKSCRDNIFREKLGRCRRCMWINVLLLMGSALGLVFSFQSAPEHVATIALLLTFVASGVLMAFHAMFYLYYRSKGIRYPTEDKQHLK
ncbi:DUF3624 domain-containing protein [Psychromonas sp. PT13]|uniref:DUF3624 domain-containing protein n=1 Tax=Psychromonas sp. PT13 TaxID=3439547 RepID=UPI003EBD9E9F